MSTTTSGNNNSNSRSSNRHTVRSIYISCKPEESKQQGEETTNGEALVESWLEP